MIGVNEPLQGRYIMIVTLACGIAVYVMLAVLTTCNKYVSIGQAFR